MANFLADILECADGDVIHYVDFGHPLDSVYTMGRWEKDRRNLGINFNATYTFEEAKPFLNYIYSDGFGSMDCHDITAWSDDYVYYIHEYDGSTTVCRLPKRPTKLNLSTLEKSNSPEGG